MGLVKNLGFQELLDSQVPESCVERKRVNHAQLTTKITLDQYTVWGFKNHWILKFLNNMLTEKE